MQQRYVSECVRRRTMSAFPIGNPKSASTVCKTRVVSGSLHVTRSLYMTSKYLIVFTSVMISICYWFILGPTTRCPDNCSLKSRSWESRRWQSSNYGWREHSLASLLCCAVSGSSSAWTASPVPKLLSCLPAFLVCFCLEQRVTVMLHQAGDISWISYVVCQPKQMREEGGRKEFGVVSLQCQLHSPWSWCVCFPCVVFPSTANAVSFKWVSVRLELERTPSCLLLRSWLLWGLAFLTEHLQQIFLEF